MTKFGLLVLLQAKPDKIEEVEKFLKTAQPLVQKEKETTAWFAFRIGPSTFGIFDAFPTEAGRQAHFAGEVAKALMSQGSELFVQPPTITQIDILADKLPKSFS